MDESEKPAWATRGESSSRATPPQRRILIVDSQPLVRRGLIALIDHEPDLTVCAAAATRRAGLEAIASSQADLVVTELSFEDGDGLDLVENIRSSDEDLPVLVFSMHDAPRHTRRAFRAGALGYVSKQETGETLLVAIRCVLGGEKYVSPKLRVGLDHP